MVVANYELIGIVVAAIILLYPIVKVRLDRYLQPSRLRIARLGEELVANEDLPVNDRAFIHATMGMAYSQLLAVIFIFLLPMAALAPSKERKTHRQMSELQLKHRAYKRLFLKSVIWANPYLGIILSIEVALLTIPVVLLGGSERFVRNALAKSIRVDEQIHSTLKHVS